MPERRSEKYRILCTRPLNPPILGDFRSSSSPQNWGARGAVRATILISQTPSEGNLRLEAPSSSQVEQRFSLT